MVSTVRSKLRIRAGCAVLALLCPLLAAAQATPVARLRDVRDLARFVPDQALVRLRALEPEVARAPALRAEFLELYGTAERRAGNLQHALALADELVEYGRRAHDDAALAKGLVARANTQYLLEQLAASHTTSFEAVRIARNAGDPATFVQAPPASRTRKKATIRPRWRSSRPPSTPRAGSATRRRRWRAHSMRWPCCT